MVSGAALAHVYVFDGNEGILLEHRPRPSDWATIQEAWEAFMSFITEDQAPPLTDFDTLVRSDLDWELAAKAYVVAKGEAETAATRLDEAKARLVALTTHTSEKGAGVAVSRYWKMGAIDYKKVPELVGVDLEQFRGASREEVRVSCTK
jgi:hypothetical protein